jgi:hypothetical protein
MKKVFLIFATVLTFATIFSLASCADLNPCKNVECGTHGTCNGGDCECESGYDKNADGQCSNPWSLKFVGTYAVKEVFLSSVTGKKDSVNYQVEIKQLPALNTLGISNFGNYKISSSTLTVPNSDDINIDYTDLNGRIFKGFATFSTKDVMRVTYYTTHSDKTTTYSDCTYTKK